MSLINDALKRLSQSKKSRDPADDSQQPPPLIPVDEHEKRNFFILFVVPFTLVILIATGAWIFWPENAGRQEQDGDQTKLASADNGKTNAPAVTNQTPATTDNSRTSPTPSAEKTNVQTPAQTNLIPKTTQQTNVPAKTNLQQSVTNIASATTTNAQTPSTANAQTLTNASATNMFTTTPTQPSFPDLTLQGIFYDSTNSSALINGRTLKINDKIKGVRIDNIDAYSVTIELDGDKKRIFLR
ncbi:MAG: hypothetical protein K9N48_08760 [Verrucomicrobia bacterium]|nr:hypothetical protein [Verrucomicrobiota bacterium]MCF7707665.1 hypothetical protein [Verrucomicrobiota bacterium]